ncbi:hypothetical protein [Chitinophaga sp. Cy-1792]|uniref:hypothetical protein n=1 Tax=Chitinophaga sp. Cy-1792 TaxID=2608339 RepID=UPI0014233E93|nr:hypothetical protein [Chitinophaga sp. Cy-1792]NIG55629.1 hypothetical protein [Chitinophaga sp. Cy-1792]
MKTLSYVALSALLLLACSKEKVDPSNPKGGQQFELFVDHYTSGSDQKISLNGDRKISYGTYLQKFPEREPGYTYVVKAKVVEAPYGMQDAPSYWFEYEKTIRKEKYLGKDTFTLAAFAWYGEANGLVLRKENDNILYGSQILIPADNAAKISLDSAYNSWRAMAGSGYTSNPNLFVQHTSDNKGYIVYKIK